MRMNSALKALFHSEKLCDLCLLLSHELSHDTALQRSKLTCPGIHKPNLSITFCLLTLFGALAHFRDETYLERASYREPPMLFAALKIVERVVAWILYAATHSFLASGNNI